MPRISAPTIAEHVARREAEVLRVATELFGERACATVSMADVAAAAGLKRTSLYRYFPDKEHLLLACFRSEIDRVVARTAASHRRSARQQLRSWVTAQFDASTGPNRALLLNLSDELGAAGPEVRRLVAAERRRLYEAASDLVGRAVGERGREPVDPELTAELIVGLVRAAVESVVRGSPRHRARSALVDAALAVVDGPR